MDKHYIADPSSSHERNTRKGQQKRMGQDAADQFSALPSVRWPSGSVRSGPNLMQTHEMALMGKTPLTHAKLLGTLPVFRVTVATVIVGLRPFVAFAAIL